MLPLQKGEGVSGCCGGHRCTERVGVEAMPRQAQIQTKGGSEPMLRRMLRQAQKDTRGAS